MPPLEVLEAIWFTSVLFSGGNQVFFKGSPGATFIVFPQTLTICVDGIIIHKLVALCASQAFPDCACPLLRRLEAPREEGPRLLIE